VLKIGSFIYCLVVAGETIDNRSAVRPHKIQFSFRRVGSLFVDLIVSPATGFQSMKAAPVYSEQSSGFSGVLYFERAVSVLFVLDASSPA
jgi:hypothetical protein